MYTYGVHLATAILLISVGSPGHIQSAKIPAKIQINSVAISQDDVKARALLNQMIDAYKRPTSFSITMSSFYGVSLVTSISFKKPNKVVVTTTLLNGEEQAVCDGKYIYAYKLNDKMRYTRTKVSSSNREAILETVLSAHAPTIMTGGILAATKNAFDKITSLSLGQPSVLKNVSIETLIVGSGKDEEMPRLGKLILSIGKDDHLLRHAEMIDNDGKTFVGSENLGESANESPLDTTTPLPDSLFTFTPPAGAKIVDTLETYYDPQLVEGAIPPALNATDTAGKSVSLSDYKGKVVLLDYWATWCAPCLGEMPNVAAAYKKYHAKGLEIVGVSLDDATTRDKISAVAKQNKMIWRQVCDGKGFESPLATMYGVGAIPFTLLIGRDGKIEAVSVRGEKLDAAVKAALAKP